MTDVLPQTKHLIEGAIKQKLKSLPTRPFYMTWFENLEVTSAVQYSPTQSKVSFRFAVHPEYLNPGKTLAGAAQTLFHDVCTMYCLGPLAREPDFWCSHGTSRSFNVNLLRPAREGDVLTMECETVSVGKRLALLRGVLKREDGSVVSTCEHELYNVDADKGNKL